MTQTAHVDLALLIVRLFFGIGLAAHGWKKISGKGGLSGTAGWFGSIGMKWPKVQAYAAAGTEIGAGLLLAAGLLTPLAAAGVIGVMIVAGWVGHRKNGFFILNNGWELTASIAVAAFAVGAIGPGKYSLDSAFGIIDDGFQRGWGGFLIAALVGIGGAVAQLGICYRPPRAQSAS